MRPPVAPEFQPRPAPRRAWIGVVGSILLHASLLSVLVWRTARPAFLLVPQPDSVELASSQRKAVTMVFIPPPRPSTDDGRSRVATPPERRRAERPSPPPTTEAPRPTPKGDEGRPSEEEAPPVDAAEGTTAPVTDVPLPTPTAPDQAPPRRHAPSIAFHGGAAGSPLTRLPPSPLSSTPHVADLTERCTPGPARREGDPVDWGVVAGRVYRLGTTEPLAGAVLQVLGTPYHTTTDANGDYVLRFDASVLKNCQQEFVRVQLDGFVTQTLVLGLGPSTRSDISLRGR